MAKKARPTPAPEVEPDPLVAAVERLSGEIRMLRDVMDEIREDFSWVTRNGLPIQPIEHVIVKRMALDPLADDWAEKLDVERYPFPTNPTASPLDSDSLDRIALDLTSAFEGVAQGQLEVVLTALDGVRGQILATLRRRREPDASAVSVPPPDTAPESPKPPAEPPRESPRAGYLF